MQFLGRGIDNKFAIAAVVYTIAGCLLGNVFRVVSPLDVLQSEDFLLIVERLKPEPGTSNPDLE